MDKIIQFFWYPDTKIVNGFKYSVYFISAPMLILSFFIPSFLLLGVLLLFFSLRSIVSVRGALINEIDEEKIKIYAGKDSAAKRAYVAFAVILVVFLSMIIFFYIKTEGILGLILTILIATLILPGLSEEIVIIKRCQSDKKIQV